MSLSDLANNDTATDHDEVDDVDPAQTPPPPPPRAADALGQLALDAGLSRQQRRLLRSGAKVVIVHTPDADWTALVKDALRKLDRSLVVESVTERKKHGESGLEYLDFLQRGRSVVLVSQAPESLIAPSVLAAADTTVVVPRVSAAILRKAIRKVTGGVARGLVAEDIAGLGATDIVAALRPGSTARDCIANLRRAAASRRAVSDTNTNDAVPLEQLPMTSTVGSWAYELLGTMKRVTAGAAMPDKVRFACLEGPAGTGKTTIAAALAKSAGWHFVPTSVGRWFADSDGNLGGVTKAAKSFFESIANAREPGVVGFIDEIDSLPNRAALDARDSQWWTPVVTYVLTEIDALRKADKPVLLVGATNHYLKLDAALIRPGRLETRVPVLLPDEGERREMLRKYLGRRLDEEALSVAARLALDVTPAQIEAWSLAAIDRAELSGRSLTQDDLIDVIAPPDRRSPADRRAVAIHEAGHAVAAIELGLPVIEVSVLEAGSTGGWVKTEPASLLHTRAEVERLGTVMLAGRAADIVLGSGAHAGARADLSAANCLVADAMVGAGLYELLQTPDTLQSLGWHLNGAPLHQAIASELTRLMDLALDLIGRRKKDVLLLAEHLVRERVMTGRRVGELLRTGASRPPVAQEDAGADLSAAP